MPGWHDATKSWQQQGQIQMVGVIEEQHGERCSLFMQWKQMGWPILVDSFNLLEMYAVPTTLLIDEHGIIRYARPKMDVAAQVTEEFVNTTYEKPADDVDSPPMRPDIARLQAVTEKNAGQNTAQAWSEYGIALATWADTDQLGDALDALEQAARLEPDNPVHYFHIGVAYRKRFDSDYRQPGDFQKAVAGWSDALALDPNNYIWRRRIQQYGPRLDKPYPFYDWVPTAREEISARGETPAPLRVEPGGSEYSHPMDAFESQSDAQDEPDPTGRIHRDEKPFVQAEVTVIPPTIEPGESARVNIALRPNTAARAHWNNEVDGTVLWVETPTGWQVDTSHLFIPNPPGPVSQETRMVEFEVKAPDANGQSNGASNNGEGTQVSLPLYALYYVCEDEHGTCLYRRQDLNVEIGLRA